MPGRWIALSIVAAGVALPGCVTEKVAPAKKAPQPLPDLLRAGIYHEVEFYFEVTPDDFPEAREWIETERELPPIVPNILRGGAEVYRVGTLHRVDFVNNMFQVGDYRYLREPGAQLYVYKRREGNFSFAFHGQTVIVPSDVAWIPSIYSVYHDDHVPGGTVRSERLQIGLATIETGTDEGVWLVNGRRYTPDTSRPLELEGAVHAKVAR